MSEAFKIGDTTVGRCLYSEVSSMPSVLITDSADNSALFVQSLGREKTTVRVNVFVESAADKQAVDNAAYLVAKVSVTCLGVTYTGFIDGAIAWEWVRRGETALAKFNIRAVVV